MASCAFMNRSKDPRLTAYTAVKQVGKGSYGEVFLVKHSKEKKQYVMKNIKLTASSAKERLSAEQEAALLSKLKHPNIVSYKESFQDEFGMLHIIMGFCEGGDLCTRLKTYKGELLPETQVVEWFVQIALALQYLHERNILHRDLKTQNIFLSKNDIIKVGDLGIARVLDGSCDLAHTVIGTPYYMSPELFANEPYNHKSDIWALGCCVYEMATLKHAFTAKNLNALMYKIIKGKVPALPSVFSTELSELVQQMMDRNAKARPSVHQLLRNSFVRKHIKLFLDRAAGKKRKSSQKPPAVSRASVEPSPPPVKNDQKIALPQPRRRSSSTGSSRISSAGNGSKQTSNPQQPGTSSGDESNRSTSLTLLPQLKPPSASRESSPETQQKHVSPKERTCSELDAPEKKCSTEQNSHETKPIISQDSPEVQGKVMPTSQGDSPVAEQKQNGVSTPKVGEKRPRAKKPLNKRNPKQNRPPRPLPPDPVPCTGTPPRMQSVSSNDSPDLPCANGSVSSARQRRRRNKQIEGGVGGVARGRVVLRSRSSSDLARKSSNESLSSKASAEDVVDGVGEGVVQNETQEAKLNGNKENSLIKVSDCEPEQKLVPQVKTEIDQNSVEPVTSEHRDGGSLDEVDEFLTLLDTTLHLPEPQQRAKLEGDDTPHSKEAFIEKKELVDAHVSGVSLLQSGRLGDRIGALRRECLLGLGEGLMAEASLILDNNEPEEAEDLLFKVLGKERFDLYAAKLQHLHLCEDTIKTT